MASPTKKTNKHRDAKKAKEKKNRAKKVAKKVRENKKKGLITA